MKKRGGPVWPLLCLGLIYVVMVFAGFFAPYDPTVQDRDAPYSPPTKVHFVGAEGSVQRPFVYQPTSYDESGYETTGNDRLQYPIRFLTHGPRYSILGLYSVDWHLFSVAYPGRIHLAGTDNYGRDVFSRALVGGQISLFAGLLAAFLSLALGTLLGVFSGFYGGWIDGVIMRGAELFIALPWLYLLLAMRSILPLNTSPGRTLLLVVAVIGVVGWTRPARLVRGIALSAREHGHVLAAKSFGASDGYLLWRHVLPETKSVLLTQATLLIPQFILAEVTLSFLGLGVGEPLASWGGMLATLQQYHVIVSDWWMFFPGLLMVVVFVHYVWLSSALQHWMPIAGAVSNERRSWDENS